MDDEYKLLRFLLLAILLFNKLLFCNSYNDNRGIGYGDITPQND